MDTTRLRELATTNGPFASVYFDDTYNTETAAKELELTWRELRDRLAEQDAPDEALDALEDAVFDSEPPVGRSGRALVATADGVMLDRRLGEPPARSVIRVSQLPYLVPLVEHGERPPAHVVAVVDRVGADVTAVNADGTVVDARTVEGTDNDIHKVPGGGWSERNIDRHADELVRRNIELAAEYTTSVARRLGAPLVVVAGESQARKTLLEALPQPVRDQATEVQPGGRNKGSGSAELEAEINELLADATRTRKDEATERFTTALSMPTGLAAEGLEAVTAAFRNNNVETLLIGDPGGAEVVTGPDPTLVAVQEEALQAQGIDETDRERADEALLLAAIAVNADVIHVGDRIDLTEGFGAILRHD